MKLIILIGLVFCLPHAGHDHSTSVQVSGAAAAQTTGHQATFNTETPTILFENWVPKTTLQYIIACVCAFLGAVLYDAILFVQSRIKHPGLSRTDSLGSEAPLKSPASQFDIKNRLIVLGSQMVVTTLGYLLMFIAMTLNVGLFVSIVVGRGVGSFAFHRTV
jgi:hypothetical protein